jgi:hypothetical protein
VGSEVGFRAEEGSKAGEVSKEVSREVSKVRFSLLSRTRWY